MIALGVAVIMIPVTLVTSAVVMTIFKKLFKLSARKANLRVFGFLFGFIFSLLGLFAVNGILELLNESFEPIHNIIIGAAGFIGGWQGSRSSLEKEDEA